MKLKFAKKKGFTLMEMLVVVLILGILATIALPTYQKTVLKSRAAEAINLLTMLRSKQAVNFARDKRFFTEFNQIPGGKLTLGQESYAPGTSNLLVVGEGNYEVELLPNQQCALSRYKQNGETMFEFSISYLRNGLGCSGDICSTFPEVVALADELCNAPIPPVPPATCPDPNFDPNSCESPMVLSADQCHCECRAGIEATCSNIKPFNPTTCECECDQSRVSVPSNPENYTFNPTNCAYECSLTLEDCTSQGKVYQQDSCSCGCRPDENGRCCCEIEGQVDIGGECRFCYGGYYIAGGNGYCCEEPTPVFNATTRQCEPCPEHSQWDPDLKKCVCETGYSSNFNNNGQLISCSCPTGTSLNFHGSLVGVNNCKCPANTTVDNTGDPIATDADCKCPEQMQWVSSTYGIDGGYCKCKTANSYTQFGTGFGITNKYRVGLGCCPEGTAGYQFNGYVGGAYTPGYTGGESSTPGCFCPTGYVWLNDSCQSCPAGSQTTFQGVAVGVGNCKCPVNTTLDNTGDPVASGSPCKCPANMEWVSNSNGIDGGYCKCKTDIGYTQFGTGFGITNRYRVGLGCCPEGTAGYQFNSYVGGGYTPGYNGEQSSTAGCFCQTGEFWSASSNSCASCPAGTSVNNHGDPIAEGSPCKCPSNTTVNYVGGAVVEGSPCKCPDEMEWTLNNHGIDGGYCNATNGNTQYGTGYGNGTQYTVGIGVCPEGTASYQFNSYVGGGYTPGYTGGESSTPGCFCPTGEFWINGSCQPCPSGTQITFHGVSTGYGECKCPANTNLNNTGDPIASGSPCKCPEGTHWVSNNNGIDGGYCQCKIANSYTQFGTGFGITNRYKVGLGCCPESTAGYQFNGYVGGAYTPGYNGGESSVQGCFCQTGYSWIDNSCQNCPAGSQTTFHGVSSGVSNCKCPANTTLNNTGDPVSANSPCKCPAGMEWVSNSNGIDGGYCQCKGGSTQFGTGYGITNRYKVGLGCCPEGTAGYQFNGYVGGSYTPGYNGGVSTVTGCFCPSGTGHGSAYQGEAINNSCSCPTDTNWYGTSNGCLQCPPGSHYRFTEYGCGGCVCDSSTGHTGYYGQTDNCTKNQCASYLIFADNTCQCACPTLGGGVHLSPNAELGCCYCELKDLSKPGSTEDPLFSPNGCYIGPLN